MAKVIMVQGTMSSAGKSLLAAGLCRIFRQDGYRAAPFKSQNMALNSFITEDGLEMGRAQVMQAEAAGIRPDVCMNPILLKPTSSVGSQVIVNGEVRGNMSAKDYFLSKKQLLPDIIRAFRKLETMADIIVIEGAGSPAEINLKKDDIVNMGLAELVDAPVLLVGDIDRGGVFAQLLGTLNLFQKQELDRVKGLVINKFRGDKTILDPGITMLEEKGGIPVTGVIPYMDLNLEDEDSLTDRFNRRSEGVIDLAVIRYPRISNFTDFNVFEQIPGVTVRYVVHPGDLRSPDMIFLPGSKNTMNDLKWMRESGMEAAVKKCVGKIPIFGICGGYQMLGMRISDPEGVEEGGSIRGMELLKTETVLLGKKTRCQVCGKIRLPEGIFAGLNGLNYEGYEIHMGKTHMSESHVGNPHMDEIYPDGSYAEEKDRNGIHAEKIFQENRPEGRENLPDILQQGNLFGTYIHGIFDAEGIAGKIAEALAEKKGIRLAEEGILSYHDLKEREYDRLADGIRQNMDMNAVYGMLREARIADLPQNSEKKAGPKAQIEELLSGKTVLCGASSEVYRQIRENWDHVAKPLDSLGAFEDITARIGAACGKADFSVKKRAILAFCADNGVVQEGVSQSGQEVTFAVASSMGRRQSSVCKMAAAADTDVIPVDIGINSTEQPAGVLPRKVAMGTRNFAKEPAMTRKEVLQALQTGMDLAAECADRGYTILGTGEMGIGNTTTSCAVLCALLGESPRKFTGRGAGLDDAGLSRKVKVIEEALEKYDLYHADPLTVLQTVGGLDIAGLAGVMIGGACCHVPVVLDGVITAAAALTAVRLFPKVQGYLIASHCGKEPAIGRALQELNLRAVIQADLALGEGTGAAMLFPLLDQAMAIYSVQTTFEDLHMEAYTRFAKAD